MFPFTHDPYLSSQPWIFRTFEMVFRVLKPLKCFLADKVLSATETQISKSRRALEDGRWILGVDFVVEEHETEVGPAARKINDSLTSLHSLKFHLASHWFVK